MAMFDFLKKYQIVLVTGPQRSGTTICARMIASDLKITYLDEGLWGVWNGLRAREIAESQWPCVLQGPGILKDVGLFNQPKCVVVVMRRDLDDIRASQERVGWNVWAEKELSYYTTGGFKYEDGEVLPLGLAKNDVAWVKYAWWEDYGKPELAYLNWYEVAYDLLDTHPMWIPREQRVDFKTRQFREKK